MEIIWRAEKARANVRKHRLNFSLARQVLTNPLSETVWNGMVMEKNGGSQSGTPL